MLTKQTKIPITKCILFVCLLTSFFYSQETYSQNSTITGTILDETNAPIPGVNVLEKGTSNGTETDFDGNFSLNLKNENSVLVVSFIGYKTQEIPTSGKQNITVNLTEDSQTLEEVVIVGYGSQKKSDLTGSIASVKTEALTNRNINNPVEALQGNVAGVQIGSSTGRLGDGFNIVIRGKNSLPVATDDAISSASPLYVVDGVPVDDIDFLNPQDIAQMDILKDASSTAIYGSRGSRGVIIITTKNGKSAKSGFNVNFESFTGVKTVARLPKMMGGEKWWYYHRSAYLATATERTGDNEDGNDYIDEEELYAAYAGSRNTVLLERASRNQTFDWYDAVLGTGVQKNHYLSVSGRGQNGMSYNLALGYQNETGNIQNESLDKYTFKTGLNHRINEKFTTGANLTLAFTENQRGSEIAMQEAFRLNPFLSPWQIDENGNEIEGLLQAQPGKLRYPDGSWAIDKTSTFNPLLEIANTIDETRRWSTLTNLYLQYKPLNWLSFKTAFSGNINNSRHGRSWGAVTDRGFKNGGLPSSDIRAGKKFAYTIDNQVNLDFNFNNDHSLKALLLQSIFSDRYEENYTSSLRQVIDASFYNIGVGANGTAIANSRFAKETLASFAVRLNYGFKDKYLLTVSNRWDGSSKFTPENRWGMFPSAALAWKISEEDFLKDQETLSALKLRLSYGLTGNNDIPPYQTITNVSTPVTYAIGNEVVSGLTPTRISNPNLKWETTNEFNIGLDFGFLNNRINGSVDVYDRLSEDLLMEPSLPLESGYGTYYANVGSVSNKGVEVVLNNSIINNDDFGWNVNLTFTKNTNKLESLYGRKDVNDIGNSWFIGEDIDSHYNYIFDGIWQANQSQEADLYGQSEGQARVVDINDDGSINPNDDRVILGNQSPDWSGSLFTTFRYKNFDLSASVITNQGVFVYSPFHKNFTDTRDRGRQKLDIDWYIPENQAGIDPQFSNSYPQPRNVGTFWRNDGVGAYRDASFVKVKNISLGYNFNRTLLDKLNLKSLRVYGNVLNPFVFTDYDGYDPEWASASLGVGRVSSITYQLGVSLKL